MIDLQVSMFLVPVALPSANPSPPTTIKGCPLSEVSEFNAVSFPGECAGILPNDTIHVVDLEYVSYYNGTGGLLKQQFYRQ